MDRALIRKRLQADEGCILKPYQDTAGKWTIGFGRNLSDVGISLEEAYDLLEHDIDRAEDALLKACDWAADLDPTRYSVLVMLTFNLGIRRLLTFEKMIHALKNREWERASKELLNSRYAAQVGQRAVRYARLLKTGEWM